MLNITNVHVKSEDKEILKGLSLQINPGELHLIMGPNGAGKSTLASVLAGKEGYEVTEGKTIFQSRELFTLSPEERSLLGFFLAFQSPVEIPGVSTSQFLRDAVNAHRKAKGEEMLDAVDFLELIKVKSKELGFSEDFLSRGMNVDFSGGEKKRNELLQLALLNPTLAVLDEIDSGLDIDALQLIATTIESLRTQDNAFLVISHNPKLAELLNPTHVHILKDGVITQSGSKDLIQTIEAQGYEN